MKRITLFILIFALKANAQNFQLESNWWQPNGKVNAMVKDTTNNLLYVGGKFDYVGPNTPFASVISDVSGLVDINFPKSNGKVKTVVSDGRGGWFLGGDFTRIGGFERLRIAHVNSIGNVSNLFDKKGFNKSVNAFSLQNNILYVGGNFNTYGETKSFGAVFNNSTAIVKPNTPMPNAIVETTISDENGGWYIGGNFTMIGDSVRNRIAHIDSLGQVKSTFGSNGFNASVNSLVLNNQNLYVGGNFTGYGVVKKNGAVIDLFINSVSDKFEEPNGKVRAAINDGKGGWYIAGEFTQVGNTQRNYLAQLDSNGHVTDWNPNPNNPALSLLLDSNQLYVGGLFTNIDGQNRNRLVAFNTQNGNITAWNPNVDFPGITCMATKANILYIGGQFSSIGTSSRTNFGAIDKLTGLVTSLNIDVNNIINDMVIDGNSLFIGGDFTLVGGITRNYLAEINIFSNELTSWNPNPDGRLKSIIVKDSMVYIGGDFNSVGSQYRNLFAGINRNTGTANSLKINNFSGFYDMSLNGNDILLAVRKFSIGTLCKINLTTGVLDSLKIPYLGGISVLTINNNKLYVGGVSLSIGGVERNSLASIDLNTQQITNWSPNSDGTINAMTILGNNIYVLGKFSNINKVSRDKLASIDLINGNLKPWSPNVTGTVGAIIKSNNSIIIGGDFLSINNTARYYLASVDTLNGSLTNWRPNQLNAINSLALRQNTVVCAGGVSISAFNINSGLASWSPKTTSFSILSMSIIGNNIYAGGTYIENSLVNRIYLGRVVGFNLATGAQLNYIIESDGVVNAVAANNNSIYVGGNFLNIGGKLTNKVAAINTQTGELINLPVKVNDEVLTIATNSTSIFIGGSFDNVNDVTRRYAASMSITDGSLETWNPDATDKVYTIVLNGNNAYVGGAFKRIGTQARERIAALNLTNGKATFWSADADRSVFCIAINNGILYAGGEFNTIAGQSSRNLAAINLSTGLALSWNPLPDGAVYSIALTNNSVYVGGAFKNISGTTRNSIATFDLTNNRAIIGNYSANDTVFCLAVYNKSVFAGGVFSSIGGENRRNLAVFNTNTGLLNAWKLKGNGGSSFDEIKTLILNNQELYLGGFFSFLNETSCKNIGSINTTNYNVTAWPFNVNNTINTMAIKNNIIYFGGEFTQIESIAQNRLAAYNITTKAKLAWNPNANNVVNDMVVLNNTLYVAGAFTTISAQVRNRLAAFDLNTNNLNNWNPNTNEIVQVLNQNNNQIIAGGSFSSIGSLSRKNVAIISPITGIATSWNPNVSGSVSALTVMDSVVIIGGTFNQIGNVNRTKIGAVNIVSGSLSSFSPQINANINKIIYADNKVFVGSDKSDNGLSLYVFSKTCPDSLISVINTHDSLELCEGKSAIIFPTNSKNNQFQWFNNGNAILNATDSILEVKTSGTYSLVLTNYKTCRNESNKITINYSPKPIINDILANAQPVNNSTVIYSATANLGSTYKWLLNNLNQDSISNLNLLSVLWKSISVNKIQLIETNNLGCVSDTFSKLIQVIPETFKTSVDTIRLNLTTFSRTVLLNTNSSWKGISQDNWLTLSPSSGKGNSSTVISVQANNSGKQRLGSIKFNAGSIIKSLVVIQDAPVGIIETNEFININIFPNPTSGKTTISNQSKYTYEMEIFNTSGQSMLRKEKLNSETNTYFDLKVEAGIYFVKLTSEQSTKLFKLIITN